MSMGEILVVMLIALIVTKPKDLPIIIEKSKKLWLFFRKLKKELFNYLANELALPSRSSQNKPEDIKEINFYLARIIQIEGKYQGRYDLESIKAKYFILNSQILANKDDN